MTPFHLGDRDMPFGPSDFWHSEVSTCAATSLQLLRAPLRDAARTPLQEEHAMNRPEKVIYTAKVHTTGGRVGASRSDDGRLELKLSRPGTPGAGTNPEQLFAAGWSACYESAMELVARRMKIALPADLAVHAQVALRPKRDAYHVAVPLKIGLPRAEPHTPRA